ncbi:hypothetical protein CEXT_531101 [Caerostris extrusa]|uniref:Uncharacterized protein n=1 Tax=Caerostris extrusa TaxID=172846 RepID=A0AAV4XDE9_CAEEX|nr:hypothetical protein CEXT_531101 [Caerostris extrusa]
MKINPYDKVLHEASDERKEEKQLELTHKLEQQQQMKNKYLIRVKISQIIERKRLHLNVSSEDSTDEP